MATQKLLIFKHASALGNAHAHELFKLVNITRKPDSLVPRDFGDYEVTIDCAATPEGVEVIEK